MPEDKQFKEYIAETTKGENDGELTAIISTSAVDRDKDVVLPKGMDTESFMKNPTVLWAHDYHGQPIGRAMWLKKGRAQITAGIEFAPTEQAQEVYSLYKNHFLKAFSIGFLSKASHQPTPAEVKANPEWAEAQRIIDEWELLEFSCVAVGANPEALTVAVKSGEITISKGLQDTLGIDGKEKWREFEPGNQIHIDIDMDNKTTNISREVKEVKETSESGQESIDEGIELKPYPNEHACRLNSPDKYDKFRRAKCAQKHDGKCIDVIYGIKAGKSEIQSLRFPKDIWTAAAAKSVCDAREGTFEAAKGVEEQETIVVPVRRIVPVTRVIKLRQGVMPHQVLDTAHIARRSISIIKGKVYE